MKTAEVILENIANLGEGPVWDGENAVLYFVDINGCKLLAYDYKNNKNNKSNKCRETAAPGRISTSLLCETPGKLICTIENNFYIFDTKTRLFTPFIENIFEPDGGNIRFNDGKCDTRGRLYAGTMDSGRTSRGKLYKVDNVDKVDNTDNIKNIEVCEENISTSNGLVFTDKYFYYIDTPSGFLWRYDYDIKTGNIENKTAFIDYREEQGGFDGMTIDTDGNLWVASWGGFSVTKYGASDGRKLDVIKLPVPNVTSCEFGGDNMNILFITTAGGADENLKKDYPLAGSLFAVETDGEKGFECNKFKL